MPTRTPSAPPNLRFPSMGRTRHRQDERHLPCACTGRIQPYKWHVNDGEEVFAVMDGEVDMHYRENGEEHIVRLTSGDIFYAGIGTEHVAHPCGEARILVIEKEGSV